MSALGIDDQEAFVLRTRNDAIVECTGRPQDAQSAGLVDAMNKLKAADNGSNMNEHQLSSLLKNFSGLISLLRPSCFGDKQTRQLGKLVALLWANDKVNEMVKQAITLELIDEILRLYLGILDVMKSMEHTRGCLLSRTSLISPLLITISFAYKIKYTKVDLLVKVLTILFVFHLQHPPLLETLVKMFSVNSSTNMDVFEVLNKLWEKTLQLSTGKNFDIKYSPGPVTLLNRIEIFKHRQLLADLIDHILPYSSNAMLLKISKDVISIYSAIIGLQKGADTSAFLTIISLTTTNLSAETMHLLIRTMQLENMMLKLYDNVELSPVMEHILYKMGSSLNLNDTTTSTSYISKLMDTEILTALDQSIYARYKVIFELLDHNYKLDFYKDFQMAILLETALHTIHSHFDLIEDHHVVTEYGSIFSIEALFIYSSFIIQRSILESISPNGSLPDSFIRRMELKRIAPVPRSNFTDLTFKSLSTSFVSIKNFERLLYSSSLCLSIMEKILDEYITANSSLNTTEGRDQSMEYGIVDQLLTHYFTSLFTALIVANELCVKAKSNERIFYDYESQSKMLKLQVFKLFEKLFQLYGSFALFLLLQFIESVSEQDLELQTILLTLLNHLVFHTGPTLKHDILNNESIKSLVTRFLMTWDDGSASYEQLNQLVQNPGRNFTLVPFDRIKFVNHCGLSEDIENTPTSASSVDPMRFSSDVSSELTTNTHISTQQNYRPDVKEPDSGGLFQADYKYRASNLKNVTAFVPQHLQNVKMFGYTQY